jgi:tripartite-type tricarboxylate transporter receptor subunit TctC
MKLTQLIYGLSLTLTLSTGLCVAQPAGVDTFPNKPVRFVVPFTAASASDILARTIGEKLQKSLGQPVIIENRPGAGGTIATAQVAKSDPDGYTLIVVSAGHVVNPALYKNLSYDTLRDLRGVIPLASLPSVLVVQGSAPQNSVNDLVSALNAQQGQVNFVSGGIGSASHMNAEKFLLNAKVKAFHIPLKGASDMALEIMTGRSQFGFMPLIASLSFIKDGKLKALAVSSQQRSPALPNVPSIAEAGHPGGEFNFWIGLVAPAKTPDKVVLRLNQEISKILQDPDIKAKYASLGAEPMPLTPEVFDQFMASELNTLGQVIQKANVKIQ